MCWQHHNKSPATLFATKPPALDVYSSALQPAFSHLRNAARLHLSLPPSPPAAVTHTFVQLLCLVLFRLLKCSSFCWSLYQHNQMTAAGTELIAKPSLWHQTWRTVQIPSLMREHCFHSNSKVFFLSQLPFSFNWIPQGPSILMAPKHLGATNQF